MNSEIILSTISKVFTDEGNAKIVNILATCKSRLRIVNEYDVWNNRIKETIYEYVLDIMVIPKVFNSITNEIYKLEEDIQEKVACLILDDMILNKTVISLMAIEDDDWQDKCRKWLAG